jgi:hypothetical protein
VAGTYTVRLSEGRSTGDVRGRPRADVHSVIRDDFFSLW